MTDKERIQTYIIQSFYPNYILGMDNRNHELFNKCKANQIKVGDLVISASSGLHKFSIGFVVQVLTEYNMIVREIGTNKTCNIDNEMFYKIDTDNLNSNELLEGEQYKIYVKSLKATRKFNDDNSYDAYILCRIKFIEDSVELCYRKKWNGYDENNPIKVVFKFEKNISIKKIVSCLQEQLIECD